VAAEVAVVATALHLAQVALVPLVIALSTIGVKE
jgi:hypothetical protein